MGYGADGAVRAVESWRLIVANAHLHAVRAQLSLSLYTGVGDKGFSPTTRRAAELATLFDQLERLAGVVATMR
ncbi:MAG: hypothetical protein L6Q83_00475 [Gammaproteobacteria bacterium]|nr:hypothetical protein [Gammaproteobacteria bacterium]